MESKRNNRNKTFFQKAQSRGRGTPTEKGEAVFWSSAGTCGFKSSRKASPNAGQRTAVDAIRTMGLQRAEVMVKGAGSGRDAVVGELKLVLI